MIFIIIVRLDVFNNLSIHKPRSSGISISTDEELTLTDQMLCNMNTACDVSTNVVVQN